MKNVAVILSGCGHLDGAEIRESVLTLLALDTAGASYKIFAPNKPQHHVVNHAAGKETAGRSRNILEESARIARGDIHDLADLTIDAFDAVVIPGGFGVAKNLCTFAFEGCDASVDTQIASILKSFKAANKPIGAMCIAPALVALSVGSEHPTLTIGNDADTAAALEKLGAKHQSCEANDCVVDSENRIVTTPAYMYDTASIAEVYAGITAMLKEVIRLA